MSYSPNTLTKPSVLNSRTQIIAPSTNFIGPGEKNNATNVMVSCQTDAEGTLFFEFSNDNINWSDFPVEGYPVKPNIHKFKTAVKGERYFRIRYENGINTQSYFRLFTYYGTYGQTNSPLHQPLSEDNDASVVKAVLSGETTDANLIPTGDFKNVYVTPYGEIQASLSPRLIFEKKTPESPTLPSGVIPIIDSLLNPEANIIDSGWLPVKQFGGGQFLHVISNTSFTVYLLNASDEFGNNLQGSGFPAIINGPGLPATIGAPFFDNYFRIIAVNTSGVPATTYSIRSSAGQVPPAPIYATLDTELFDFFPAPLQRSVTTGRKPNGSYANTPADGRAFSTDTLLGANLSYISPWVETKGWNSIQLFIKSDQISRNLGLIVDFTDNISTGITRLTKKYTFTEADINRGYLELNLPPILDAFRLTYTNGLIAVGIFYISANLKTNSTVNTYTSSGSLLTANTGAEIAYNNVPNIKSHIIEGRNPDIDIGQTEDIWQGGGAYTGQPVGVAPQAAQIFSSNAIDDIVGGSGARKIRICGLKSETSSEVEFAIYNLTGTVPVVTLENWYRIWYAEVVTTGSNQSNVGTITVRMANDTANVFIIMAPGVNTSQVAAFTVPFRKKVRVLQDELNIVRSNGSAGSASVQLLSRKQGETFNGPRREIQTGGAIGFTYFSGRVYPSLTDLKFKVISVSDSNTVAGAFLELEETIE